jgi:hypothetical protein
MLPRFLITTLTAGVSVLMSLMMTGAANAASPFPTLQGSWAGSGRMQFENGSSETLRCNAYYTSSDGGGQLGLAIRCASASNRIDIRGRLTNNGGRVSGTWQETTFNASGSAAGRANDSSIILRLSGDIAGSMSVSVSKSRQTVSISTQTASLRGVRIGLSRR